jgi:hypothetical protein
MEHVSGLKVWFTEPPGIVTQLSRRVRADMDMVHFLSRDVDARLFSLPRPPGSRMVFIHDWRRLDSYSTEVRNHMVAWGKRRRADIGELVVVQGTDASPLARMGISMASTALGMFGLRLTVVADPERARAGRELRVREMDPG